MPVDEEQGAEVGDVLVGELKWYNCDINEYDQSKNHRRNLRARGAGRLDDDERERPPLNKIEHY